MTRSSAAVTLLALAALVGCGSETPSGNAEPRGVRLTLVRTLEHGNDADALAFAPDGRTLATGGGAIGAEGTVKLWSTSSWSETASFSAFAYGIYDLVFTPDGTRLAVSGYDANAGVKLWEVPGVRLLWARSRRTPHSLAVSPEGRWLAVCSGDDRQIEIVTLADGTLARSFTAHQFGILSLAFSGDGRYLVSGGGGDRLAKLWRVPAFSEEAVFSGSGAAVWSVAASPDGRYVASGTLDSLVRLWRTSDHSLAAVLPQEAWIWSVAFSPDGELLATGGDAGVFVYRVSDGLEAVATAGPGVRASDVRFSPDSRFLAASLEDNIETTAGTIRVWSVDR